MLINEKINQVQKALKAILPNASFGPMIWGDAKKENCSAVLLLSNDNKEFVGSRYLYDTAGKMFLHFTKLHSLYGILESKSFRFNNLGQLADPREFYFAGNTFYIRKDMQIDARTNMYSASFCDDNVLQSSEKTDKFNLWRLYGDNGNGVCLAFKFLRNSERWKDFHISKVEYGLESKEDWLDIKALLDTLNRTNPKVYIDCAKIFSFHKSILYKPEREVRVLFDSRQKRNISHTTYSDQTGEVTFPKFGNIGRKRFLELSLLHRNGHANFDSDPMLVVEKVILGYNLRNRYEQIKKDLQMRFGSELQYVPEIVRSGLENSFWGKQPKKSLNRK